MFALLQAVQDAVGSFGTVIQGAAATVILGLQGWQVKTIRDLRDEVQLLRWRLVGERGDNGVTSEVKDLKRSQQSQDDRISAIDKRLSLVEHDHLKEM